MTTQVSRLQVNEAIQKGLTLADFGIMPFAEDCAREFYKSGEVTRQEADAFQESLLSMLHDLQDTGPDYSLASANEAFYGMWCGWSQHDKYLKK